MASAVRWAALPYVGDQPRGHDGDALSPAALPGGGQQRAGQVTLDGGQRHVDDGEVQHDHELRHRQRQQQRQRVARQKILTRDDRPRLWAVIDEAVIRRVVGGTEVMRGQLRYLADSAQQGKTTIQVVPYRAGAHAGTTGPFVILDFEEPTDPAMVYVETLAGTSISRSVRM